MRGSVTRGTTGPNRLRRVDRWVTGPARGAWSRTDGAPLVVDLGYGATPGTTVELAARLRAVRADVRVLGIEIDPARVTAAQPLATDTVTFARGGFEVPTRGLGDPQLIRAFNVLRQYDEAEVAQAWALMGSRLAPSGLLVEGTCDELGRLVTWVVLTGTGPVSLVLSWRLRDLVLPSVIAERLPKALIHRNVPGEPVHALLRDLDAAWHRTAAYAAFGPRQRFEAAAGELASRWPIRRRRPRWRLGEIEVDWRAVAPQGMGPTGSAQRA